MRYALLLLFLAAVWPFSALACRELPQDMQFKMADTVLIGWISSTTVPELESLTPGASDTDALNQSLNSHRIFRIAVTETQKGQSTASQTVEVYRCTGAYNTVGSRVIAYRFPDGSWRVSQLPLQGSDNGP